MENDEESYGVVDAPIKLSNDNLDFVWYLTGR